MTDYTYKKLQKIRDEIGKIMKNHKDTKIPKRAIAMPIELIFDVIKSGDLDFKVNFSVINMFHNMLRKWLYS